MTEAFASHFAYWFCFLVMAIGLWGVMIKRNLVKKTIGLAIFQAAVILLFVVAAYKREGNVPVYYPEQVKGHPPAPIEADAFMNPLPHTLMLTAIVVGVATMGVALALLIRAYQTYGTLDEDELIEKLR